jgi:hypothetical protein
VSPSVSLFPCLYQSVSLLLALSAGALEAALEAAWSLQTRTLLMLLVLHAELWPLVWGSL